MYRLGLVVCVLVYGGYLLPSRIISSSSSTNYSKEIADRVVAWIDNSTSPCDDFYQFSCGGIIQNDRSESEESAEPYSNKIREAQIEKIMDDWLNTPGTFVYEAQKCCDSLSGQTMDEFEYSKVYARALSDSIDVWISESNSVLESFWDINAILKTNIFQRFLGSDDAMVFFYGISGSYANYSEAFKTYETCASSPLDEEIFGRISNLFEALKCAPESRPFPYLDVISSLKNLSFTYGNASLEVILANLELHDNSLVYTTKKSIGYFSRVNHILISYNFADIKAFFMVFALHFRRLSNEPQFSCNSMLFTKFGGISQNFPQEIREFLFDENNDKSARILYHYIKNSLLDSIESSSRKDLIRYHI
jgi:hypothetical protein